MRYQSNITFDSIEKYRKRYLKNKEKQKNNLSFKEESIEDLAFQTEEAARYPFSFSVDLPTRDPISQGLTGRCWLFAGVNFLMEKATEYISKGNLPEDFRFSTAYLSFWDKMEKANCFLEKMIHYRSCKADKRELFSWLQYGITDGGFWTYFTDLVEKYGVIPECIMPETKKSSDTEELNRLLNHYLRKTAADIRNAYVSNDSLEELYIIKDTALDKIYTFLCRYYGSPPQQFSLGFKQYTPNSLRKEVIGNYTDDFISVISLPYESLPLGEYCRLTDVFQVNGMHEELFLNLPLDEMKKFCVKQLKAGIPVVCTADDSKMLREELQLWDDGSFDYERITGLEFSMSRKDYFRLKEGSVCHSMIITGVNLSGNDLPDRWKIKNSYGADGMHRGYYTCSDTWFDKYMVGAVIHKDYLKDYRELIHTSPNPFYIWDIL